jgi:hypothetical protein
VHGESLQKGWLISVFVEHLSLSKAALQSVTNTVYLTTIKARSFVAQTILRTVDLIVKMACLVNKKEIYLSIKSTRAERVSTRRSSVLSISLL